mmetsp:Transcript_18093/g.39579  ORF Transcript_18093/g.39579 Transcript_18093/m.39579 type:complete len:233 (+) Transcript_18093:1003-1701(+)
MILSSVPCSRLLCRSTACFNSICLRYHGLLESASRTRVGCQLSPFTSGLGSHMKESCHSPGREGITPSRHISHSPRCFWSRSVIEPFSPRFILRSTCSFGRGEIWIDGLNSRQPSMGSFAVSFATPKQSSPTSFNPECFLTVAGFIVKREEGSPLCAATPSASVKFGARHHGIFLGRSTRGKAHVLNALASTNFSLRTHLKLVCQLVSSSPGNRTIGLLVCIRIQLFNTEMI